MAASKVDTLLAIVQQVADERPQFFAIKGEGSGNLDTNSFMREVHQRALATFGADYSEQRICDVNAGPVDFYFPDEAAIVEIALTIRLPNSEYEKDIFKALIARECADVRRLVLTGKPGARRRCDQPGRAAVRDWAYRHHGLVVDVYDIENNHQP